MTTETRLQESPCVRAGDRGIRGIETGGGGRGVVRYICDIDGDGPTKYSIHWVAALLR